jgi:hypothetical protein
MGVLGVARCLRRMRRAGTRALLARPGCTALVRMWVRRGQAASDAAVALGCSGSADRVLAPSKTPALRGATGWLQAWRGTRRTTRSKCLWHVVSCSLPYGSCFSLKKF